MTWSPLGVLRVTLYAIALKFPRAARRAETGLAATDLPAMRVVERRASDIVVGIGKGGRRREGIGGGKETICDFVDSRRGAS